MMNKANGSLAGKVAVVTGASGGLGRAVAVDLARHGARVAVCSRREAEGRETVELVREAGGDGLFARCDVSRDEEVRGFIALVVARLGRIDCAVNNAASIGVVAPLKEYPEEVFDHVMSVNVKGTWLCMKHEIRAMLQGGAGGSIVNVSSVSGLVGVPWGGAPYSASKHAVVGLTRCAALEVGGAGIRVNALCPSGFDSELNKIRTNAPDPVQALQERVKQYPLKRRSTAEEIARTVVWLCGDNASFMTGAAVAVDGGLTVPVFRGKGPREFQPHGAREAGRTTGAKGASYGERGRSKIHPAPRPPRRDRWHEPATGRWSRRGRSPAVILSLTSA